MTAFCGAFSQSLLEASQEAILPSRQSSRLDAPAPPTPPQPLATKQKPAGGRKRKSAGSAPADAGRAGGVAEMDVENVKVGGEEKPCGTCAHCGSAFRPSEKQGELCADCAMDQCWNWKVAFTRESSGVGPGCARDAVAMDSFSRAGRGSSKMEWWWLSCV